MIRFSEWWNPIRRTLAAGLLLALAPAPTARADDGAAPRPDDPGRLRRLNQAFQDLTRAVRDDSNRAGPAKGEMPARPAKTVRPPALDAARVDALLDRLHDESKAKVSPLVDDETFVRRASLDVTGKLPKPAEIERFVASTAPDKHERLIDSLLESPNYARNWARYWRDVVQFHATTANTFQVRYAVLEDWLTERLAKNTPWDEVARDLITGAGRNDESGPANFAIAQMGQPVEMAGEVSRIFLGVQIQCAQCHDHPTDPWKRQQFHEFAAFFAGLRPPRMVTRAMPGVLPVFAVAVQPGRPRYTMPDLKDPKTLIPIQPRFFLAQSEEPAPAGLDSEQRRALAASYVTGQDNPWFAKAYVNRIWYALIGSGFYNPVDDLGPTRAANAPEVLEALADAWREGGHDVRWLFRTILNTKAYRREVRSMSTPNQALFASNCPVRLRSDQLLDALVQALDLPIGNPGGGPGGMGMGGANAVKQAATKQAGAGMGPYARFRNPRVVFNFLFGVDPSTPNEDVLGTIPQALFLMNSPQIGKAIRADGGTILADILADHPETDEALEALYLRVLARRPNPKEVEVCARYLAKVGDRKEAFEDILWNLVNSTEFVSRR